MSVDTNWDVVSYDRRAHLAEVEHHAGDPPGLGLDFDDSTDFEPRSLPRGIWVTLAAASLALLAVLTAFLFKYL